MSDTDIDLGIITKFGVSAIIIASCIGISMGALPAFAMSSYHLIRKKCGVPDNYRLF